MNGSSDNDKTFNFITLDSNFEILEIQRENSTIDKRIIEIQNTSNNEIVILWENKYTQYITSYSFNSMTTFSFKKNSLSAKNITTDDEGSFYIGGYVNNESKIIKLNSKGNILWSKTLSHEIDIKNMVYTIGGELVIIAESYDNNQATINLLKLDNSGNVISSLKSVEEMHFVEGSQNNSIIGFYAEKVNKKVSQLIYLTFSDDLVSSRYLDLRDSNYIKILDKELYKINVDLRIKELKLEYINNFTPFKVKTENTEMNDLDVYDIGNIGTWSTTSYHN